MNHNGQNYLEKVCITCGVIFFLNSVHYHNLRESKETFYCPNGHGMVTKKTLATTLQEQLDHQLIVNTNLRAEKISLESDIKFKDKQIKKLKAKK